MTTSWPKLQPKRRHRKIIAFNWRLRVFKVVCQEFTLQQRYNSHSSNNRNQFCWWFKHPLYYSMNGWILKHEIVLLKWNHVCSNSLVNWERSLCVRPTRPISCGRNYRVVPPPLLPKSLCVEVKYWHSQEEGNINSLVTCSEHNLHLTHELH